MGFLNRLFGGSAEPKDTKELPWISLTAIEQLQDIEERSKGKPQIIFKYSTRCGINRMMMNSFVASYEYPEYELDLYYLDIIKYREVSNTVSQKFQLMHESPQVLVIKNGVVVAHASHGAINNLDFSQFL